MVTVRALLAAEIDWANERYAEIDFVQSTPADQLVVAEVGDERAGLGRIVSIDTDVGELGGIYVFAPFRGLGVAHAVVEHLLRHSQVTTLYCLPFSHLQPFYASCGFTTVDENAALPPAITAKIAWCRQQYADPVSTLKRSIAPG